MIYVFFLEPMDSRLRAKDHRVCWHSKFCHCLYLMLVIICKTAWFLPHHFAPPIVILINWLWYLFNCSVLQLDWSCFYQITLTMYSVQFMIKAWGPRYQCTLYNIKWLHRWMIDCFVSRFTSLPCFSVSLSCKHLFFLNMILNFPG